MWGLGIEHWIIVAGIVTVLFGYKKVPAMMRDLGKTVKEIRNLPAATEGDDDGA